MFVCPPAWSALPTQGPPVITATLERSVISIAARCDGARHFPVRFSIHGAAFSTSIFGQGGEPRTTASAADRRRRARQY